MTHNQTDCEFCLVRGVGRSSGIVGPISPKGLAPSREATTGIGITPRTTQNPDSTEQK